MSKREDILLAAQGLFAQFGLKKVTTDDIAREARVSKATIYKHYRNKAEIFDDVAEMEARELLAAITTAVEAESTVVEKFRAHLLTRMHKVQELVNFYRVTQESWGDFWPHLAKLGDWFLGEERKIVKAIMQQGIDEGELDVPRLDLCAHITVVTLRSIELPWAMESHDVTPESYANMMIAMMYNGIRKR